MVDLLALGCKLLKNACSHSLHARYSCLLAVLQGLPDKAVTYTGNLTRTASSPSGCTRHDATGQNGTLPWHICMPNICHEMMLPLPNAYSVWRSLLVTCICRTVADMYQNRAGSHLVRMWNAQQQDKGPCLCFCKLRPALRYPVSSLVQFFCCLQHALSLSC